MKWIALPVEVEASVIVAVDREVGDGYIEVTLDDGRPDAQYNYDTLTPEMVSRYTPAVGDYYVVQSDGYVYINPKAVFERKYRQCEVSPRDIKGEISVANCRPSETAVRPTDNPMKHPFDFL